jgi:tRNA-dihydrouridine synthase B
VRLRHPSILAAMAGRNDGKFCRRIGDLGVGMVTIGGISVDEKTMAASRKMIRRGRREFIFDDLYCFLEENIPIARKSDASVCVNIRSATIEGYVRASEIIADFDAVVEIDAHCRQKEMIQSGAGQCLLEELEKFRLIVTTMQEIGIPSIVKFRGNVRSEKETLETVQPDVVHIDSYRNGEKGFDFTVFEKIRDFNCFKIGNNSVSTPEVALKVLEVCDAFSFAQIAWNMQAVRDLVENVHP